MNVDIIIKEIIGILIQTKKYKPLNKSFLITKKMPQKVNIDSGMLKYLMICRPNFSGVYPHLPIEDVISHLIISWNPKGTMMREVRTKRYNKVLAADMALTSYCKGL
jgi:hypothetical protein